MDNMTLMTTWLQMWNENPALAHDVMTDDCRQWSGQGTGLDTVVGPDDQVRFVTGYRAQHINVFRPRVLVDAGDQMAYLWDVTLPDGTVWTGADANLVRDGRVSRNWTFVSNAHSDGPDLGPANAQPTHATTLDDLCQAWISLWNTNNDGINDLVTDDVATFAWAGDTATDLRGAPALAEHLTRWRQDGASGTRAIHRRPVVDPMRGRAALLWTCRAGPDSGDVQVGGIDILNVRDGRVSHAWSLTGRREFRY
jgi:hypothetical protein